MQNSTFDPQNIDGFNKTNLAFFGKGIIGQGNLSSTTTLDYVLTDDVLMTGGIVLVKNAQFGDKISLKIVHPVYGVVNTFVDGFYVQETSQEQLNINLNYPAKLPAGLTIRCEYTANAIAGLREIAANLFLHKVLL